jgi:hypothetical protein
MVYRRYPPTVVGGRLSCWRLWKKSGKQNHSVKRAGFRLDSIDVGRPPVFLAAAVRSGHLHATALALHVSAAIALRIRQVRKRKGTDHRRREKRQQKRKSRCGPGNGAHSTVGYLVQINHAIPCPLRHTSVSPEKAAGDIAVMQHCR